MYCSTSPLIIPAALLEVNLVGTEVKPFSIMLIIVENDEDILPVKFADAGGPSGSAVSSVARILAEVLF